MIVKLSAILGITNRDKHRILSMSSLFFFIMFGMAIGRSATDAFFIKVAGSENIPIMYIVNSLAMVLVASLYSRIEKIISRKKLFLYIMLFFGLSLTGIRMAMEYSNHVLIPYVLFTFYEVSVLVILMHYWTYANDLFDPREGKRLFPLIGGIGLIGLIIGGFFTSYIALIIGTANLFVLWVFVFVLGIPLVVWTDMTARWENLHLENLPGIVHNTDKNIFSQLGDLLSIPLLRTLAIINIPLWLVVHTIDYLFYRAIDEMFPNQDQLSSFLGSLNAIVSLSGILVQIFLTRFFLQRLGVATSYAIYSITMSFAALSLFLRGFFPAVSNSIWNPRNLLAISARFLDEGILNSVYDSAQQLLFNAFPSKIRGQARAVINGVVEPAITALTGVLLILLEYFGVPGNIIAGACLVICCVWVYLSMRIHDDYTHCLVHSLDSKDPQSLSKLSEQLEGSQSEQALEILLKELHNKNSEIALLAFEYIQNSNTDGIEKKLLKELKFTAKYTGIEIIKYMGKHNHQFAIPEIMPYIYHNDPEIQSAVINAIAEMQATDIIENFEILLKSKHLKVRSEVIITLLLYVTSIHSDNPAFRTLQQMAKSRFIDERLEVARIIRKLGHPELLPLLASLIKSKYKNVQVQAIRALGIIGNSDNVPTLIHSLGNEDLYHHAENSLIKIGKRNLQPLHNELLKRSYPLVCRERLVVCIGEVSNPISIEILSNLISGEHILLEDRALMALARIKFVHARDVSLEKANLLIFEELENGIRRIFATLNQKISRNGIFIQTLEKLADTMAINLLLDAITRAKQKHEELVFACLEILHDPASARVAYTGLKSKQKRDTAEAIELIEDLGPEGQALSWTLELLYNEENLLDEEIGIEDLIMELLAQKHHSWLTACTLYTIGQLKIRKAKSFLNEFVKSNDAFIHQNALIAMQKLGMRLPSSINKTEVKKMEINMERILFLRSVPIFTGVDGKDLHWINEITKLIDISAGHTIFHENDPGDAMYIIVEGQVRVITGKDTLISIMAERECFGEMAILDDGPRSATVVASENAQLLAIQRDDFQRLLLARPQISIAMFKNISMRLRDLTIRLGEV